MDNSEPQQLDMFVARSPEDYEALRVEIARLTASRNHWAELATEFEDRIMELEQAYCQEFGISPEQLLYEIE